MLILAGVSFGIVDYQLVVEDPFHIVPSWSRHKLLFIIHWKLTLASSFGHADSLIADFQFWLVLLGVRAEYMS